MSRRTIRNPTWLEILGSIVLLMMKLQTVKGPTPQGSFNFFRYQSVFTTTLFGASSRSCYTVYFVFTLDDCLFFVLAYCFNPVWFSVEFFKSVIKFIVYTGFKILFSLLFGCFDSKSLVDEIVFGSVKALDSGLTSCNASLIVDVTLSLITKSRVFEG